MIVCDRCKTKMDGRQELAFFEINEGGQACGCVPDFPALELCDECLGDLEVVLQAWLKNGGKP